MFQRVNSEKSPTKFNLSKPASEVQEQAESSYFLNDIDLLLTGPDENFEFHFKLDTKTSMMNSSNNQSRISVSESEIKGSFLACQKPDDRRLSVEGNGLSLLSSVLDDFLRRNYYPVNLNMRLVVNHPEKRNKIYSISVRVMNELAHTAKSLFSENLKDFQEFVVENIIPQHKKFMEQANDGKKMCLGYHG